MSVALVGKSSGAKDSLRPGISQSHRGRLVRNLTILTIVAAFLFMMVSNALNPESEEAVSPEDQQVAEFEMQNNIDNAPSVDAPPANPFEVRRVASLPSGFEGSDSYNNLIAAAEGTAAQISTYSSKQTPEQYVDSVEGIDDDFKADLLGSSKSMWPEIKRANIVVKGESAGIDPIIREYNEESTLATVEVVVKQTISRTDGTSSSQTRAYLMNLVGVEQGDGNTTWTVGGFLKQ